MVKVNRTPISNGKSSHSVSINTDNAKFHIKRKTKTIVKGTFATFWQTDENESILFRLTLTKYYFVSGDRCFPVRTKSEIVSFFTQTLDGVCYEFAKDQNGLFYLFNYGSYKSIFIQIQPSEYFQWDASVEKLLKSLYKTLDELKAQLRKKNIVKENYYGNIFRIKYT